MVKPGDTFNIGEIRQESGIYRIKGCECTADDKACPSEKKCEISEEQLTIPLAKGNKFPPCKNCTGSKVVWEFVKKA